MQQTRFRKLKNYPRIIVVDFLWNSDDIFLKIAKNRATYYYKKSRITNKTFWIQKSGQNGNNKQCSEYLI